MSHGGIFSIGRVVIGHRWARMSLRATVSFSQMNCNCARFPKPIWSNAAMTDSRPEHSVPTKILGPVLEKRTAAHEAAKGLGTLAAAVLRRFARRCSACWTFACVALGAAHGPALAARDRLPWTVRTCVELGRLGSRAVACAFLPAALRRKCRMAEDRSASSQEFIASTLGAGLVWWALGAATVPKQSQLKNTIWQIVTPHPAYAGMWVLYLSLCLLCVAHCEKLEECTTKQDVSRQ